MSNSQQPPPNQPPQLSLPFASEEIEIVRSEPKIEDPKKSAPTVSQLNRRLRGHIEGAFFDLWVKGEVSSLRIPTSGHAYFSLKDATSQIRAVLFKGALNKLKFQLKEGTEVILHGNVSVYEPRGEYQIVCDYAEPVGAGALQLAFEQLKAKLQAEGLFDPKFKQPLPFLPKRIGILTSPTGAAVRDILKVLSRRFNEREIIILPATVQGDKAAGEIVNALENAEAWNLQNPERKLDVLIVGRGGGSMEDLWCFNEEIVARAIFKCKIPIISAVGHEIDFTIADFVADLRAPTPSAAAEMVLPRKEELEARIQYLTNRFHTLFGKKLENLKLHLDHLGNRLLDPRTRVKLLKEKLTLVTQQLFQQMNQRLKLKKQQLSSLANLLNSLSPLQVLGRGYSMTRNSDGKLIRSISEVVQDSLIATELTDGVIHAKVLSTIKKTS